MNRRIISTLLVSFCGIVFLLGYIFLHTKFVQHYSKQEAKIVVTSLFCCGGVFFSAACAGILTLRMNGENIRFRVWKIILIGFFLLIFFLVAVACFACVVAIVGHTFGLKSNLPDTVINSINTAIAIPVFIIICRHLYRYFVKKPSMPIDQIA